MEQAHETLLNTVLDKATRNGARHAVAWLQTNRSSTLRFARNQATQHKYHEDGTVSLAVAVDGREAIAETNRTDADSLAGLAERAVEAAHSSPVNPEFFEPVGPQKYSETTTWFQSTVDLKLEQRARVIGEMCQYAEEHAVDLFGNLEPKSVRGPSPTHRDCSRPSRTRM